MTRRGILLVLVMLLAATCNSNTNPSSGIPQLVITSDMPLSGVEGPDAIPLRDAIALAIHDQGTIGGYRLGYMPFDDALIGAFDDDKAEQNIRLMLDDPRVMGLIGPYNSGIAQEEIPLGNPAHLVMISPSNTQDCLTFAASDQCLNSPITSVNNYFRIAAPDSAQISAGARFAVEVLHVKRFAVLDDETGYGQYLANSFAGSLQSLGGTVAMRGSFGADTTDLTPLLNQARDAKAEAVYVGGSSDNGACRVRAVMVNMFPAAAYMLGDDGFSGPGCVTQAGGVAGGANDHLLMMVSESQPSSTTKVYQEFKAHNIPPVSYVFGAYDCARILMDAIRRAIQTDGGRVPTRSEVLAAVAATSGFSGVTGTYTFLPNGDAASPAVSVYRVVNGQWTFWENAS